MARQLRVEIRDTESRDIYGCVRRGTYDGFPKIVCLCGSTRFMEAFQEANLQETLKGNIVVSVGCNTKSDANLFGDLNPYDAGKLKEKLDDLHKRKIDLADEVLVLNVGGYIGESTRSEIEYATAQGKPVRYLETKEFTCRGCGVKKTPDGAPKNAAFIWTNEKTKTRRSYCYDCDDKLIQDVPLPELNKKNRSVIL